MAIGIRDAIAAKRPLLISVAAGIRASDLQRWLPGVPIVRSMPNRPALQGCGMTGLYATAHGDTKTVLNQVLISFQTFGAFGLL